MPRAEHRPSPIAGRGLFSSEPVPTGGPALWQDGIGDLNHSCDPNLGWSGGGLLVARRDIRAGDELTLDYATAIADPDFAMVCHCETYRCRQMIEGTDWRIPQLQKRYAGFFRPDVADLIATASR